MKLNQEAEVRELLKRGDYVFAVKTLRKANLSVTFGLKEAKDVCDSWVKGEVAKDPEAFKAKVRNAVLDALDSVAPDKRGWGDGDLTALFKAIDKQAEIMLNRKD